MKKMYFQKLGKSQIDADLANKLGVKTGKACQKYRIPEINEDYCAVIRAIRSLF